MRKYLLLIAALVCNVSMTFVNAQSCKINGATDGGSVEVIGCSHKDKVVTVMLANDSQEPAKVTVEVTINTNDPKNKEITKRTPYPVYVKGYTERQEITFDISGNMAANATIISEKVTSLTGTKCQ